MEGNNNEVIEELEEKRWSGRRTEGGGGKRRNGMLWGLTPCEYSRSLPPCLQLEHYQCSLTHFHWRHTHCMREGKRGRESDELQVKYDSHCSSKPGFIHTRNWLSTSEEPLLELLHWHTYSRDDQGSKSTLTNWQVQVKTGLERSVKWSFNDA